MAYFPNGTAGDVFREHYCDRCKWDKDQSCPIWAAHLMYNYDECNNDKSILHMLISMTKDGLYADECYFFEHQEPDMFDSPGGDYSDK
jgi:hypothetical protein